MGGSLTKVDFDTGNLKAIGRQLWVHDTMCDECHHCERSFTFARRRHHCRVCGNIYCSRCSSNSCEVLNRTVPVRICDLCVDEASQGTKSRQESMDFDQLYKEGTVVEVQYETNGQWVLGIVTNGAFVEETAHVGFVRSSTNEFQLWPLEAYFIALQRIRLPRNVPANYVSRSGSKEQRRSSLAANDALTMGGEEMLDVLRKCIEEEKEAFSD